MDITSFSDGFNNEFYHIQIEMGPLTKEEYEEKMNFFYKLQDRINNGESLDIL